MADFWGDVREDVLRRLHQYAPTMPFEMKVLVAEDAAREVESYGTPFPDGTWPLSHSAPQSVDFESGGA